MSYAIFRIKKLKSWSSISGSSNHTHRLNGLAPNADPSRLKLNTVLIGTPQDATHDIRSRVNEITDKPRKNAVLCMEMFLGASPEWFLGKSEKQIQDWAKSNIDFLKQTYGANNVMHAVLHRDESTPHIVAYIVPEMDGRLNAKVVMGDPEKMVQTQTDYANHMERFGLKRGESGSKAIHQDVKRFYTDVNRALDITEKHIEGLAKPVPPSVPLLASSKAKQAILQEWIDVDTKRTSILTEKAAGALLVARQAKLQLVQIKQANSALSAENDRLKEELGRAYEELGLDKGEIGRLRKADISLVAQLMGYMGEIKPKENAIDLVKRVNQFNYEQAIAWLYNELGPEQVGLAVSEDTSIKKPERPFTPAENVIKQAVNRQTDALGCDSYRITIISKDENVKPFLPGKPVGSEKEKFYSRKDLINLIPWLRFRNNQGDHINVTPMDDHAYYVFLDDARVTSEQLEKAGFKPCLVQKSSWDNEQIVFKVPKDLPREDVVRFFNQLNRVAGDENINGLRHPIRLAGFRNLKSKHEREGKFPFVQIVEAVNRFCMKSAGLIQRLGSSKDDLKAALLDVFRP
jgi:hypothetical protein